MVIDFNFVNGTLQTLAGFAQAGATIWVAIVLKKQTDKIKKVEMHGQMISSLNVVNSAAISSLENLKAFDSLGRKTGESDSCRRRRWCAFVWLESLQSIFLTKQAGMLDDPFAERSLSQQLNLILKDDLVFWLVKNRGFASEFYDHCARIREVIYPGRSLDYTEEEAIRNSEACDL